MRRTKSGDDETIDVTLTRRFLIGGMAAGGLFWPGLPGLAAPQPTGGINLSGVLPMDVVPGTDWTCCYGLGALTHKWSNGPLFDVIGPDGATFTIHALNGYPDVKQLADLMAIDHRAGIKGLLCPRIYDQSGNGRDAIQTEIEKQPAIWLIDGTVALFFGGILSTNAQRRLAPQFFAIPEAASFNSQSFSAFCIFKPYTSSVAVSGTNKFSTLFCAKGASGFLLAFPSTSGRTGPAGFLVDLKTFGTAKLDAPGFGIQQSVVSASGSANRSTFGINERLVNARALSAGTHAGGILGCDQPTSGLFPNGASGRMQAFLVSSTQLPDLQGGQIRNALYRYGSVHGSSPINIVIDGASLDQGQGGDPSGLYAMQNGGGYGWSEIIQDRLSTHAIQWNNVAASGNTIANCASTYRSITSRCFNPTAAKNILIGPNSAYGNSLNPEIGKRTGEQAYGDFLAWLALVKANRWTRILCLVFPDQSPQGAAYNALMLANAGSNGIEPIDMTSQTPDMTMPYTNSDGHPAIAGYQAIAASVFVNLRPLLESP